MIKSTRVLIIEDDVYALNMMGMLLARDWRTRVIGEIGSDAPFEAITEYLDQKIDVVILDSEIPGNADRAIEIARFIGKVKNPPRILYTATILNSDFLDAAVKEHFSGYVLKGEILYALATAAFLSAQQEIVITPGIVDAARAIKFPKEPVVLGGADLSKDFTRREKEIAYLGILFNLTQRDISDELTISLDWVSEAISNAYEKLEVHEILNGETRIETFFDDPITLEHCKDVLSRPNPQAGPTRKAPWMSTLAFHLLTRPKIQQALSEYEFNED